ncbi:MAG TPA: hypothetical protein VK669_09190 [Candidatus Limnocylindrales bacterium]|nr:hypothetical protein [Candidatus Limnocylindrales bacterium]
MQEYDVTASESAAGQVPGSARRSGMAFARAVAEAASLPPFRARTDPRTTAITKRLASQFRVRATVGRRVQSVRTPSSFSVGATRVFHVAQGTITGSSSSCTAPQQSAGSDCWLDVTATLQAVSNHAYVWVDNAVTSNASYGYSAADWNTTASTFDTDYARETVAYGPAFFTTSNGYEQCDTSGNPLPTGSYQPSVDLSGSDPHISMLITNALESTGEGGYFDFRNDLNDQELNCATKAPHMPSNQLPMFVAGADKYSSTTYDETFWRNYDMPRTLPHEFQHYLHALNKVLVPDLNQNNTGWFDDSVVDEGCSELAEDLVLGSGVNSPQSWEPRVDSFFYLYQPGNFSVPAFTGYDSDPLSTSSTPPYAFYHNTAGSYGAAYLLARYMYDRFGGDAAMHRLYASHAQPSGSGANLQPIVAEAGNGETWAQLYSEFAAALAARNVASTDPRFTFGSNVLLRGQWSLTIPGGGTYNVLFNGPRSPEDLTNSTPETLPRIKLTPGSTVQAKLITGATLFFNVAPSGGSLVELNSTSAPSVDGALTQGAYDDSGACYGPPSSCHP